MKQILKISTLLIFTFLYVGCSEDSTSPTANGNADSSGGSTTGTGGSLARFTIANDHLYIVNDNQLYSYSLSDASKPSYKGSVPLWGGVETIFGMGNHLFIGTQNGVLIYDISSADDPQFVSNYVHITSCDPVIAKGDYAYSTLRTGQQCWRGNNQLDVINIRDITRPFNELSINLENPSGLGIYLNDLFICDNGSIKQFDITTPDKPQYERATPLPGCFDIIINGNTLIAVHTAGVSQYTIAANGSLTLLSTIN